VGELKAVSVLKPAVRQYRLPVVGSCSIFVLTVSMSNAQHYTVSQTKFRHKFVNGTVELIKITVTF